MTQKQKRVIRPKVGDIFEVLLKNGTKGYVQYIGNDITQLNSDVVRIFKKRYSSDVTPSLEEIVKGEIEFYAHVVGVEVGEEDGSWKRIGNSKELGDPKAPFFRDSRDFGNKVKISERWSVWHMNEEMIYVGKLDVENVRADIGYVTWPQKVIERMQTGKYSDSYP